ncbi:MAG: DUF5693 family protein [Synergistaceae bacterium]|jgi:hypothetical protein|nr:DUF5693 family protein [Synergistaceae bacterium]
MPGNRDEEHKKTDGHETKRSRTKDEDDALSRGGLWTGLFKHPVCSAELFFWVMLTLSVLMAGPDLAYRLRAEWGHRVVAMVADYRDLVSLSKKDGSLPGDIYGRMAQKGVRGITVAEFTGKDLASGVLPLEYGPLASLQPSFRAILEHPFDSACVLINSSEPMRNDVVDYIRVKMPDAKRYSVLAQGTSVDHTLMVLPYTVDEIADSGILPDFSALEFSEGANVWAIYRPAAAAGIDSEHTAAAISWLGKKYTSVSCVMPSGLIVAGYPNIRLLAGTLKENGISVAQAEFLRQIGSAELFRAMLPEVIPLHSLVRDELIARRLSRDQVVERMVRAVHERSIRLVLVRPYDIYNSGKLPVFIEDVGRICDALRQRGYSFRWPKPLEMLRVSKLGSMAVATIFLVCFSSFARRYFRAGKPFVSVIQAGAFVIFAAILGIVLWREPSAAKFLGGFCAAFVATEAAIRSLDNYERPFAGLLAGLVIVTAGGLCIAAGYGSTAAMLRIEPFSGVKLTLLLPPVLILANDLKNRVHPESLADIMVRPPIWGELMLAGALIAAAMVLALRSDNVSFVPGWEIRFRDALERALWVRPRTKEFLVGYPCLIIYYALVRRGWAVRFREVFRLGSSLAFASAANTFCHFHTMLPLTMVRVVNGWWLGILVGFIALVLIDRIGGPIWRRGGREIFY